MANFYKVSVKANKKLFIFNNKNKNYKNKIVK